MRVNPNPIPPNGTETVHEAALKIDRIMRMDRVRHEINPCSMTLESTLSGRMLYTRTRKSNQNSREFD